MKLRLHQYLSKTGAFRSKEELIASIKDGEVSVGSKTIKNPHYQFSPNKSVFWKGKKLAVADHVYLLLNKPAGFLSSRLTQMDIRLRKKSIYSLLHFQSSVKNSLFSVGRLDEDTEGLLIVTNDGKLCSQITDPKHDVPKTYCVHLEKPITGREIARIEKGITISLEEDGKRREYTTKASSISQRDSRSLIVRITEGKKREVKHMFEAVGNKVVRLKRTSIGSITLSELRIPLGKYKQVDKDYIEKRITQTL